MRDDFRLLLVVLGVQHFVVDIFLLERLRKLLGCLDRSRAHQHRGAAINAGPDVFDDGFKFLFAGQIDEIVQIIPTHGHIGWNYHAVQPVYLSELEGLGIGRAGHTRQLVVDAEEILKGCRGQSLTFTLDLDPLFRFYCLVQTLRQPPAGHGATGVLINQHHLTLLHNVFNITLKEHVGPKP